MATNLVLWRWLQIWFCGDGYKFGSVAMATNLVLWRWLQIWFCGVEHNLGYLPPWAFVWWRRHEECMAPSVLVFDAMGVEHNQRLRLWFSHTIKEHGSVEHS
ncbi:hypothetical protein Dimus_039268 [Dionaea muscipula]